MLANLASNPILAGAQKIGRIVFIVVLIILGLSLVNPPTGRTPSNKQGCYYSPNAPPFNLNSRKIRISGLGEPVESRYSLDNVGPFVELEKFSLQQGGDNYQFVGGAGTKLRFQRDERITANTRNGTEVLYRKVRCPGIQ